MNNDTMQAYMPTYGEENFVFEVLEEVQVKDDVHFNLLDELTLLEEIWIEKLNPFMVLGIIQGGRSCRLDGMGWQSTLNLYNCFLWQC